jgi:hypothetical protein
MSAALGQRKAGRIHVKLPLLAIIIFLIPLFACSQESQIDCSVIAETVLGCWSKNARNTEIQSYRISLSNPDKYLINEVQEDSIIEGTFWTHYGRINFCSLPIASDRRSSCGEYCFTISEPEIEFVQCGDTDGNRIELLSGRWSRIPEFR